VKGYWTSLYWPVLGGATGAAGININGYYITNFILHVVYENGLKSVESKCNTVRG
jgi:hypothetical protein